MTPPLHSGLVESEILISDYGLLGDTRTATLVSSDRCVDRLCLPRFDGEPVFGRLVGGPEADRFRIPRGGGHRCRPAVPARGGHCADDVGHDRWSGPEPGRRLLPSTLLVRHVVAHDGPVEVCVEFDPGWTPAGPQPPPPPRPKRAHGLMCDCAVWRVVARCLERGCGARGWSGRYDRYA